MRPRRQEGPTPPGRPTLRLEACDGRVIVISDTAGYTATEVLGPRFAHPSRGWPAAGARGPAYSAQEANALGEEFFKGASLVRFAEPIDPLWRYLLVSEFAAESQYERLIRIARGSAELPDGVACVARSGSAFQGFRGRSWIGNEGNIHLSVHLAPMRPVDRFETILLALAAVSVVEAIDAVPGLRGAAGIKWVNDILIGKAKVAGVLAYSQTRGSVVTSIVLGIGLNVARVPAIVPTAFVPTATALRRHLPESVQVECAEVLRHLLTTLAHNYRALLRDGWRSLMDRYRERSVIQGRHVLLSSDDPDEVPRVFAAGPVERIGDGLELILGGRTGPITRGRLILPDDEPAGPGRPMGKSTAADPNRERVS
jgi:BirA family transcriptional regulator, biotin operon repressor / biotin---[acetyl-CoA-carboxylase] ligase